jgi:hypothetical protein
MGFKIFRTAALVAACLVVGSGAAYARPAMSDAQVRQAIIRESIASYPGPCACPYNSARNGSSCGRRSAYSRPGGYAPLCYPRDISKAAVEAYRHEHGAGQ